MKIKESTLMSCIAIYIVILLNVQLLFAHKVPHVHRNQKKRQSSSLISFDIEEQQHQQQTQSNDYYFEVDTSTVNLVCTIKNYDLGVRVQLVKDIDGKSYDLLDPSFSRVVNEYFQQDARYSGRFFPNFTYSFDSSVTYKALFTIKIVKLIDNGVYRCVYGNLNKQINIVVYKKLSDDDISITIKDRTTDTEVPIPNSKAVLTMNNSYDFICKVVDQYPKSSAELLINNQKLIGQTVDDHQSINSDKYSFDMFTITSTLSVVVTNKQNNNELTCIVNPNVPQFESRKKTIKLEVHGISFIDDQCPPEVKAKIGDKDVQISCLFYANPETSSQWLYKKPPNEADAEPKEITNEAVDGGDIDAGSISSSSSSDNELNVIDTDGDSYTINRDTVEPNLFRASLVIKEIQSEKDFKKFVIKIETDKTDSPLTREIQLSAYGENDIPAIKFESKGGAGGTSSCSSIYERSKFHSIITLTIAFIIIIKNYLN